jgi:hypothetical protein
MITISLKYKRKKSSLPKKLDPPKIQSIQQEHRGKIDRQFFKEKS